MHIKTTTETADPNTAPPNTAPIMVSGDVARLSVAGTCIDNGLVAVSGLCVVEIEQSVFVTVELHVQGVGGQSYLQFLQGSVLHS